MAARARATAQTQERILRAVLELHVERYHDQITLDAVAERAGVTVQTVLRHFGTRDRLVEAAGAVAEREVVEQRGTAPVGDVAGAVENLFDHYEEWAASALRLLAQEDRVPPLRALAVRGRQAHYAWVDRAFGPYIERPDRRSLRAQLITLTDVYVWKILRLDLQLERAEAAEAVTTMIRGVLPAGVAA